MVQYKTRSYENLRVNLRALMVTAGISQGDLSIRSGIARPHINRILNGKQLPRIDILDLLAEALEVPTDRLIAEPKKISRRAS